MGLINAKEAVPHAVVGRVGNFEFDLDSKGRGVVKVNGRPVACRGFALRCDVESLAEVEIKFFPEMCEEISP